MASARVATYREWRARHQLSQNAAAAQFHITQPSWCLYERGRRIPRLRLAKRIAKITSIPLERVLSGTASSNGHQTFPRRKRR